MVNEIALVLLYGLLGWKVAALYLGTGLFVAMCTKGMVLGRLPPNRIALTGTPAGSSHSGAMHGH